MKQDHQTHNWKMISTEPKIQEKEDSIPGVTLQKRQPSISSTESTTDRQLPEADLQFTEPKPNDVLLKSSEQSRQNPGNIRFHETSDGFVDPFKAATSKEEKNAIVRELANAVDSWQGRFLDFHETSGKWYIVGEGRVHRKCFVELRRKVKEENSRNGTAETQTPDVPPPSAQRSPTPPPTPEDPLSRKMSLDQIFQSIGSVPQIFSSNDSVARLLMSQSGISVDLPPLEMEELIRQGSQTETPPISEIKLESRENSSNESNQTPENGPSVENQGVLIQKLLQSISRASQSASLGQGPGTSTNSNSTQTVPVGFFASREWGNDLGQVDTNVDFQQVFQTASKLQQQDPKQDKKVAGTTKPTKGTKRDWNAIVMKNLEASITNSSESAIAPASAVSSGVTPPESVLMAAAVASLQNEAAPLEEEEQEDIAVNKELPIEKDFTAPTKQLREEESSNKSYYVEPADEDVLLGRGGRTNNHPGNKRYLEAKDTLQAQYLAADKNSKTIISQNLVDVVHDWGGRFLKLDLDVDAWFEVDNTTARKKCSQSLREVNTPEERAAKRARYSK